jgi:hypothetical protein
MKKFKLACGASVGHATETHFRSGARFSFTPTHVGTWLGFRLAKEPPRR